jgi:hypothetical protein
MTKVELLFKLTRPLDESLMERIADAHSIYGMYRVQVLPNPDRLRVEYDASRLSVHDVEAALHASGIPAERD